MLTITNDEFIIIAKYLHFDDLQSLYKTNNSKLRSFINTNLKFLLSNSIVKICQHCRIWWSRYVRIHTRKNSFCTPRLTIDTDLGIHCHLYCLKYLLCQHCANSNLGPGWFENIVFTHYIVAKNRNIKCSIYLDLFLQNHDFLHFAIDAVKQAVFSGNLPLLKYFALTTPCALTVPFLFDYAAHHNHIDCVWYLHQIKPLKWHDDMYTMIQSCVVRGHLQLLIFFLLIFDIDYNTLVLIAEQNKANAGKNCFMLYKVVSGNMCLTHYFSRGFCDFLIL